VNAGHFRHRILLRQPNTTQGVSGEQVILFVPFKRVWAEIEPIRGSERLIGNQPLADMDTLLRIRWSPEVDQVSALWSASHQNVVYDFKEVDHVKYARKKIEIRCQSGLNNG
jgi:SPP1 family predicted phage head-tail adaptor